MEYGIDAYVKNLKEAKGRPYSCLEVSYTFLSSITSNLCAVTPYWVSVRKTNHIFLLGYFAAKIRQKFKPKPPTVSGILASHMILEIFF